MFVRSRAGPVGGATARPGAGRVVQTGSTARCQELLVPAAAARAGWWRATMSGKERISPFMTLSP
ncbi:hypothetical protein GCM10023082_16700 [Streptomyces tremellae]|uniref:Uncharacterized protein n=1 Tax=Streptomyces tremellae TaxID=1124239 RepID=A0ABP7EPK9_9ACTN